MRAGPSPGWALEDDKLRRDHQQSIRHRVFPPCEVTANFPLNFDPDPDLNLSLLATFSKHPFIVPHLPPEAFECLSDSLNDGLVVLGDVTKACADHDAIFDC
jgi:hypothetical protein